MDANGQVPGKLPICWAGGQLFHAAMPGALQLP